MAEVSVRTMKNGPLEIKGEVEVLDHQGKSYTTKTGPLYFCRCGQSGNRPFCDGSHMKNGFQAEEAASQQPEAGFNIVVMPGTIKQSGK